MGAKLQNWVTILLKRVQGKKTTRVTVKYDAGFGNHLHLRGDGAGLSWNRGVPLKNVSSNRWVWETDDGFKECNYKVLLNDERYEGGDNRIIACGKHIEIVPRF